MAGNTQGIGGGLQILDLGGVLGQAQEISKLQLLRAQIASEGALMPLKIQKETADLAKTQIETQKATIETGLKANEFSAQPEKLQNDALKLGIEVNQGAQNLFKNSIESIKQTGDYTMANTASKILTQNQNSFVIKNPDPTQPGTYVFFNGATGENHTMDPFFDAKNDPKVLSEIAARKFQQERATTMMSTQAKNRIDQRATMFGLVMADPSSRKLSGQYQQTVDSFDKITAVLAQGGVHVPDNLETMSPQEKQKLIAQWDKLPRQLVADVTVSLARGLSGGIPTDHGTEMFLPDSYKQQANNWLSKITNAPQGQGAGAFLLNMAETTQRERNLARAKQLQQLGRVGEAFADLNQTDYGRQRFEAIVRASSQADVNPQDQNNYPNQDSVLHKFNLGVSGTPNVRQKVYQQNDPNNPNSPLNQNGFTPDRFDEMFDDGLLKKGTP